MEHGHPIAQRRLRVLTVQFLIQFFTNVPEEALGDGLGAWVLASFLGELKRHPCSWLQAGQVSHNQCGHLGSEPAHGKSPSFFVFPFLFYSAFHINKAILTNISIYISDKVSLKLIFIDIMNKNH